MPEAQLGPITRALVGACFGVLVLGLAPPATHAAAQGSHISLYYDYLDLLMFTPPSPQGPNRIRFDQTGVGGGATDLRFFVVRSGGQKQLVGVSLKDPFDLTDDPGPIKRLCTHSRKPGKTRSEDGGIDLNIVLCRWTPDLKQLEGDGSPYGDLICIIEPAGETFDVSLDIHSHSGDDRLSGGSAGDELNGGEDDDVLRGGAGSDYLYGLEFPADGTPAQVPQLDSDEDWLFGEAGADRLWGGPFNDVLVGGADVDHLCGTDALETDALAYGCEARWNREGGYDRTFSSELLGRDLDTRNPAPGAATRDYVDCRGSDPGHVQYDTRDTLQGCPTEDAPQAQPPQLGGDHPTPADRTPACPRYR